MKTIREYLGETPAPDTLKAATQPKKSTTDAARALEIFMKLAPDEQEKHLDYLEKSLSGKSNDAWNNAGVGDDVAAKNRKGLKDHPGGNNKSLEDIKKKMKESFPEFSEDLQQQFAELFVETAERVSAREALFEMIAELFTDDPSLKLIFASDQEIGLIEELANRTVELEDALEVAEAELEMLMRKSQSLSEEAVIYVVPKKRRSSRNLAEDFEPNEDNVVLMNETSHEHTDPAMRKRLEFLERTTKNVDEHKSNTNLLEAWKMN
jgi:hypothetical protein